MLTEPTSGCARRGRVLGWLEDYGATGRQRRRDFASNLVQRPVHGVTHADDADRPAQRQFLAAEEMRATVYERLLPLVATIRREVTRRRNCTYAGASTPLSSSSHCWESQRISGVHKQRGLPKMIVQEAATLS